MMCEVRLFLFGFVLEELCRLPVRWDVVDEFVRDMLLLVALEVLLVCLGCEETLPTPVTLRRGVVDVRVAVELAVDLFVAV